MALVVYTKPCAESIANDRLSSQGIEAFLPLASQSGKIIPLFPRYLFAWPTDAQIHKLFSTAGVSSVLTSGDRPANIPEPIIEEIRSRMEAHGGAVPLEPPKHKYFSPGQPIRIINGAYSGTNGLFVSRGQDRIVVLLTFANRSTRASIPERYVA